MKHSALQWHHAGSWILAGTVALACAWKSERRWLLAALAMAFYARGAWYVYLAVRREAYERNPALVIAKAERIYVAGSMMAVCLCVVSLFRGEGVLGAVASVFVIVHMSIHLYLARMWNRPGSQIGQR